MGSSQYIYLSQGPEKKSQSNRHIQKATCLCTEDLFNLELRSNLQIP